MSPFVLVAVLLSIATSCGGRDRVADCGKLAYCPATDVCCPEGAVCGTGDNGCPRRGCCIGAHDSWDSGATDGDDGAWPAEPYYPGANGPSPPAGRGRPVAS